MAELYEAGPKPYSTAAWTFTQTVEDVDDVDDGDDGEDGQGPSWANQTAVCSSPYSTKAWAYSQVVIEDESSEEDEDGSSSSNFLSDLPYDSYIAPYATATWTFFQTLEEFDEASESAAGAFGASAQWWETIDDSGLAPYSTAAWAYFQDVEFEYEFVSVSLRLFYSYDEEYYPRINGFGVILDSGYFGQKGEAVYDSAYYDGGERGVIMKRKLARVMVYDQLADSPGSLSEIPQSLGLLSTEPDSFARVTADPAAEELIAEDSGSAWASIDAQVDELASMEIIADGDILGSFIEGSRRSVPSDDRPPGTLLGSVSYEILGTVATITDWEHLNWQDDTPVFKATQVILNELPDCVIEVKVLDPPHAFWTALGFKPDFKGDPYLHLRVA